MGGYTLIPATAINNQDRFLATNQLPNNGYLTSGDLVQTLVMQPPNQLSLTNSDAPNSNELVPRTNPLQQPQFVIQRSLHSPPESMAPIPAHNLNPHTLPPHNRQVFSLFDYPHDISEAMFPCFCYIFKHYDLSTFEF